MRIDKLLEYHKIGSRRQVKELFRRKQILIDGLPETNQGKNVDPLIHEIWVEKQRITTPTHTYIMLNKPQGIVSAVKDDTKQTVIDLIKREDYVKGLTHVGRLDRNTEGLMLLTDNGQLAYHLLQPKFHISKRYEVKVNGKITEKEVKKFAEGISFSDGIKCLPATLEIFSSKCNESHVFVEIKEGKFHQIKKMFLCVNCQVIFLKRISMGSLILDQKLKLGEYRSLTQTEVESLKPYFNLPRMNTKNKE